jgi:non-specific serine/threonine protein kinase
MDTAQDPELQVQLFGAASALFDSTEYPLPPTLVPLHERATTAARVALGRRFEQAWNAGQSLSLDQVLELAGRLSFPRTAGLSDRELEVARLVARGLTDREIADQLAISPHTVDNHLRHIFAKLNLSTRAALAAWVVRAGVPP